LKNDLISIIDGININLSPIDVILQKAWKLWEGRALENVLQIFCHNQLTMVQHLAKETWDFFKVMYEHVNRSMRLVVKKKSTTLIMQEGESTTSFLEKIQDLLNQMACVGLVVNDQDAMMQFLGALLASYKIFVIIIGNMLCTH
jgi:hypothetical protein